MTCIVKLLLFVSASGIKIRASLDKNGMGLLVAKFVHALLCSAANVYDVDIYIPVHASVCQQLYCVICIALDLEDKMRLFVLAG